jgi:hypothetical protein
MSQRIHFDNLVQTENELTFLKASYSLSSVHMVENRAESVASRGRKSGIKREKAESREK